MSRGNQSWEGSGESSAVARPAAEILSALGRPGSGVPDGSHLSGNAAWATASPIGRASVQFAISLVLARILAPEEFGLAAIALLVVNFGSFLTELGLRQAVVAAPTPSQEFLTAAFWLNALSGVGIAAVVVVAAEPFAEFFAGTGSLVAMMRVAALTLAVDVGLVHQAILEKVFRFRRLATIEMVTGSIGSVVTLGFAWRGFGAMSLVLGPLVGTVVRVVALWIGTGWRPSRVPTRIAVTEVWARGRPIALSSGVQVVAYWSDTAVLGRTTSAHELGLYRRAFGVTSIASQVEVAAGRVMLSSFSEVIGDRDTLTGRFARSVRGMATVAIPVAILIAVHATAVMLTLYGDQWREAGSILAILVIAIPFRSVARVCSIAAQALGHPRLIVQLGIGYGVLDLAGVLLGSVKGAPGVAAGIVMAKVASVLYGGLILERKGQMAVRAAFARSLRAPLVAGFALLAVVGPRWIDGVVGSTGLAALGLAVYGAVLLMDREVVGSRRSRRHRQL